MKLRFFFISTLFILILRSYSQSWVTVNPIGSCTARGESALANIGNIIYLLGSRGIRPVDAYDTKNNTWHAMEKPPIELHHFQAITYKNEIWVLNAFTGGYPHEKPVDHIYIFNPKSDQWRLGDSIPNDRLRGSGGATLYKDKIYIFGGETDGHWDGNVAWLDAYDLRTKKWTVLADAPHARDHVSVVIKDDKLYAAGGRRTNTKTNNVINIKEASVDVYDIKSNTWITLPPSSNIPTQRAGAATVLYNNQIILMGGESDAQVPAHSETESFDIKTFKWTKLSNMNQGRHGTGAVIFKNKIYIAGGAGNRGGGPELGSMETFVLK